MIFRQDSSWFVGLKFVYISNIQCVNRMKCSCEKTIWCQQLDKYSTTICITSICNLDSLEELHITTHEPPSFKKIMSSYTTVIHSLRTSSHLSMLQMTLLMPQASLLEPKQDVSWLLSLVYTFFLATSYQWP